MKTGDDVNILESRKKRFAEIEQTSTITAARVTFLQELLDSGMSKRDASKCLAAIDPRVSEASAETIVYTNFSGRYRKSRVGISRPSTVKSKKVVAPKDVGDDEGLL